MKYKQSSNEEKMILHEGAVEDHLLCVTKGTIDQIRNYAKARVEAGEDLPKATASDMILLYVQYAYTAKWQNNYQCYCTTAYAAQSLAWTEPRVRRTKAHLKEIGLIDDVRKHGEGGKVQGHYIKLRFFMHSGKTIMDYDLSQKTTPCKIPHGGSSSPKYSRDNNRNTPEKYTNANPPPTPCMDKAEGSVDVHIANPPPGGNDRDNSTGECKPGDLGYAKNSGKRLTSAPPGKPSKKSANQPSERALEIEENFHKILEETFPRIAASQDEKSRTEQAAEVDKCVRLDNVNYDEVEKAVMWAATHKRFWQRQFRSLKKLRKPDREGTKYVLYFLDEAENEKQDECPYGEIVKIYREFEKKEDVHWLPAPPKLGYTKFLIRRAWEEWADRDVEWFRNLFARCARSQFLSNNEKRIFFSLEWILREEKYCNLVQGRYDH